ncbi:MAG: NAD-dependent epimerase/dehydratase family protein [Halioglobus sp.]
MNKVLVIGASGFLGSHVTRQLAEQGRDVRILVRASSDTGTTDGLDIERLRGDVFDPDCLADAMRDCDVVYYCVVDTRAWLRDPAPLYKTNVDGLKTVLDVALKSDLKKFVYTSTFGTIGRREDGRSTEADAFNWYDDAPDYIRCRVDAENLFLTYCKEKNLPGVACCVGNTYGPGDSAPTPHGDLVRQVALGKMPFYWHGGGPSLGIADAARGMLAAEKSGRVGERYIFAERWVSFKELFEMAAEAAGTKAPALGVPDWLLYTMAAIFGLIASIRGRDSKMSVASIKCSKMLPDVDSTLAQKTLAWTPKPIEESVGEAVAYYLKKD